MFYLQVQSVSYASSLSPSPSPAFLFFFRAFTAACTHSLPTCCLRDARKSVSEHGKGKKRRHRKQVNDKKKRKMLNASELNAVVSSAVGNGILMALVLDASGNAIATGFSGTAAEKEAIYAPVVAATANMWRAYARNELAMNKLNLELETESLEQMVAVFPDKKICAMSVADTAVVSLVSLDDSVTDGYLKLRTAALQRKLDRLLRPVMVE